MIHGAYFAAKAEKHAFIPTEDGRISNGPSATAEDLYKYQTLTVPTGQFWTLKGDRCGGGSMRKKQKTKTR